MTPLEKLFAAIFGDSYDELRDWPIIVFEAGGQKVGQVVEEVLDKLSPRERRILLMRFGFEDGKPRTLEELGKEFNVNRERIRQIEAKALRRLRHHVHSRRLRVFLYKPTKEDKRARAMRSRLLDILSEFYPEKIAWEIAKQIKRPYLKRALRSCTNRQGNIAEQVRLSCGLPLRFCKNCGAAVLPNWDFCSRECARAYKTLTLVCDWCGKPFERGQSLTIYRLGTGGFKHYYCSKSCSGKALGNRDRRHFREVRDKLIMQVKEETET